MLLLDPLVLVFADGDCLPFHRMHTMHIERILSPVSRDDVWSDDDGRCIPSLLAPSALVEEGGLAPYNLAKTAPVCVPFNEMLHLPHVDLVLGVHLRSP